MFSFVTKIIPAFNFLPRKFDDKMIFSRNY